MRYSPSFAQRSYSMLAGLVFSVGGGLSAPAPVPATLSVLAVATAAVISAPASAATVTMPVGTVELSPAPPNVTRSVAPNIVLTFDDSGSMAQTNLPDGLPTSKKYYYSSNSNPLYYNPNTKYVPPLKPNGTSRFPDSTYTSAWRDGICANTGSGQGKKTDGSLADCTSTVDLSKYFRTGNVFSGSTATPKEAFESLNNISSTIGSAGGFYYDCPTINSETSCVLETIGTDTTARQNFANWFSYYRTRIELTRSAMSDTFAQLGTNIRVTYQFLNAGSYVAAGTTTYDNFVDTSTGVGARSKFFSWLYGAYANHSTPTREAIDAVGKALMYGKNVTDTTNPYWEADAGVDNKGMELTCRQNFSVLVTDGYWNTGAPASVATTVKATKLSLPDGTPYDPTSADSKIFWNVGGSNDITLSNIAFNYWATNLRPDFTNPADATKPKLDVPTSIVDFTGPDKKAVTWNGQGAVPSAIYFNPKNDPASWPHVVQYMVTLGVNGTLAFPGDYDALRAGTKSWPAPTDNGAGDATDIDDTWHAAVNSRGAYLEANDPPSLVAKLNSILTNIAQRNSPQSTSALNSSVLADGALGFVTGYSSADWSGTFKAAPLTSNGGFGSGGWDAGALLTARTASRTILTATENADGSFNSGTTFTWSNLDNTTASTGSSYVSAQTLLSTLPASSGSSDTGSARLDWISGNTSNDGTLYRKRSTLLGAIINSQAVFVSYPSSNYRNTWPAGSPEALAMASDAANCGTQTPPTCHSYEYFVLNNMSRRATVYIGANDGMLHAFDASLTTDSSNNVVPSSTAGTELFAYVPRSTYANLGSVSTRDNTQFMPTVDGTPVVRDVFFSSGSTKAWHTILVGGLRLGGRGVYALDVTDPTAMAADKVLWEFNSDTPAPSTGCVANYGSCTPSDLGYTFGQPNVGRLANGKWVVLVPGGYFPDCTKAPYSATNCPAPMGSPTAGSPAVAYSALFVLDAQTGGLIAELKTPTSITGVNSYGLSSPVLGDYNNDQIDDIAFAGDLNGSLWRYDLSSASPTDWTVTLAYKPATPGNQPITTMPRLFPDPVTNRFIVVFGTGKYLGASDSTSGTMQSIYGIRDRLDTNGNPITVVHADLQEQLLYEAASGNGTNILRGVTSTAVDSTKNGWFIDLKLTGSPGERVVVTPGALFDTNRVIITTLIPGSQDPCSATINGALMVLDAATGGAGDGLASPLGPTSWGSGVTGVKVVGGRVVNPPTGGSVPVATPVGGGSVLVPGLQLQGGGVLNINDAIWRRRSWRQVDNQ